MTSESKGPVAAICRTCGEAAGAAEALRRRGVDPRRIAIVSKRYPTPEAAAGLRDWRAVAPAWVTAGCLNAIGAGLEGLGLDEEGVRLCRRALDAGGILVVVQATARRRRSHDR